MNLLARLGSGISARHDLGLVALLVSILMLMILPMPLVVMDTLIACNMALAVLVLVVSVYLKQPLEFSTFPSIILFCTVFRLAISVATTRLILVDADAGQIIETFGNFVVSGNVVVGLVIFLIITTVQFLVITKGAERIAEVSARFTLDAMPGKQMSIESEIRSGDIEKVTGRKKRQALSRESQFFGAMDGAMKFVKGDAIAGLIIILINLIGGITLGVAQQGLSFGEAVSVYSLLTVGDGLVAQIPALFIALCAGAVVTRVTAEDSPDLGTEMMRQLFMYRQGLRIAALIVGSVGFLPGFPLPIFLGLSAAIGLTSFLKGRDLSAPDAPNDDLGPHLARPEDRLAIRLAEAGGEFDWSAFCAARSAAIDAFHDTNGYRLPSAGIRPDTDLDPGVVRIDLDGVPVVFAQVSANHLFARGDPDEVRLAIADPERQKTSLPHAAGIWVERESKAEIAEAGIAIDSAEETLWRLAEKIIVTRLGTFIGPDEIEEYLSEPGRGEQHSLDRIHARIDGDVLNKVIRRLMSEAILLRPRYAVLGAIAEWVEHEQDPIRLAEYARQGIKRQICYSFATGNNVVSTYIIDNNLDQKLREAVQNTEVGGYIALGVQDSSLVLESFGEIDKKLRKSETLPVVVAANDIRRYLRRFLSENEIHLPVISQQELAGEFSFKPLGIVRMKT